LPPLVRVSAFVGVLRGVLRCCVARCSALPRVLVSSRVLFCLWTFCRSLFDFLFVVLLPVPVLPPLLCGGFSFWLCGGCFVSATLFFPPLPLSLVGSVGRLFLFFGFVLLPRPVPPFLLCGGPLFGLVAFVFCWRPFLSPFRLFRWRGLLGRLLLFFWVSSLDSLARWTSF
jgi:hypothetical protein